MANDRGRDDLQGLMVDATVSSFRGQTGLPLSRHSRTWVQSGDRIPIHLLSCVAGMVVQWRDKGTLNPSPFS
jgi:hypothetical protein